MESGIKGYSLRRYLNHGSGIFIYNNGMGKFNGLSNMCMANRPDQYPYTYNKEY